MINKERGYWIGDLPSEHKYDRVLSKKLVEVLRSKNVETIIDLGCGLGLYTEHFITEAFKCDCFDGNPDTVKLTNNLCKVLDLSQVHNFEKKYDCVLSLEVGEHIPKDYEDVFIQNTVDCSKDLIIVSWATPNQGGTGHFNEQSNDYIAKKYAVHNFKRNFELEAFLRADCEWWWFKNTILVFEKVNIKMNKRDFVNTLLKYPTAWTGHGEFAMKLVSTFKPNTIVDLGVDYGFSTFCLAYPQVGTVYGIDWFQGDEHTGFRDTFHLVTELLEETGLANVNLVKGDFNEIVKVWSKQIDLLHIDGLHTYEAVSNDYKNWSKFCTENSIILFHDVESFPHSVGKFFSELEGFKVIKVDSAGLGIITKSESVFETIKQLLNEI